MNVQGMGMRAYVLACTLALIVSTALAAPPLKPSAKDEARVLIGIEYTPRIHGERISPAQLTCTDEGGGLLNARDLPAETWSYGLARCQGRMVVMLQRKIGEVDGYVTWHIVDTLLLPPVHLEPQPDRPNALRLFEAGDCEIDGKTDPFFIALVRWGDHEQIDWRTGVEQAWTFDIDQSKIVTLSTKRIICYRPEPA